MGEGATIVRCVAVIEQPIAFAQAPVPLPSPSDSVDEASASESSTENVQEMLDTGILVFPPSSLPGGSTEFAATVLVTGEASKATPEGKCTSFRTVLEG